MKKILVICDGKEIPKSFVTTLAKNSYELRVYGDPLGALEEIRQHLYELVIIDLGLPRVNGFSIYRRFVEMDREVNICFLTTVEVRKNEFDILFPDLNVKFFLTKPLSASVLLEYLRNQCRSQLSTNSEEHTGIL